MDSVQASSLNIALDLIQAFMHTALDIVRAPTHGYGPGPSTYIDIVTFVN